MSRGFGYRFLLSRGDHFLKTLACGGNSLPCHGSNRGPDSSHLICSSGIWCSDSGSVYRENVIQLIPIMFSLK
jgi:hypothetical protein